MPGNPPKIKFKLQIAVPMIDVYNSLVTASGLTEWLCSAAQLDLRKGGRIYLWWENGFYTNGEFLQIIPGDRVVFSWHGKGEPGVSRVRIALKPDGDNTILTLNHTELGAGRVWDRTGKAIKRGWALGLENLKSVLETGEDLRFSHRPMLGFTSVQSLSAEEAIQLGLPDTPGLLVLGLIEGACAQKAGLQEGDYLVKFAGQKADSLVALNNILDQNRAGMKVKLTFYRNGKKYSTKGELSRRPMPEIPITQQDLADALLSLYEGLNIELVKTLEDVDDAWINLGSTPNNWSIRETLGHLIANEREMHAWISRMIEGQEADFTLRANQPVRVRATISSYPDLEGLISELKRAQAETIAMIASLPEDFAKHRRSFWRLGLELLQNPPLHYQEHIVLMSHLIDRARKGDLK